MNVYILFGQRKCAYPGQLAPEALEVMDEFAYDENGDWLRDKLKEAEKTNEFEALRILEVALGKGSEEIRDLLIGIPQLRGHIVPE